ncbi:hypothetical protein Glove_350g30 [Diversispora epigaea]|uniref:BACK domain-containing protein n=1 Tax=Diversispora epigaea TaxID=1348612 RepID=A0A397HD29_9GLOM|nr:hypothetical protein Glove_350g30 [Diversispora epigaea]
MSSSQKLQDYQDFCNNIIDKHPNTIFESEKFLTLPEDTLIPIIKQDDLKLEESKIWEYVIRWGKAKNTTLHTNIEEWTSDNFVTLKQILKQCLPHVKYLAFLMNMCWISFSPISKFLNPSYVKKDHPILLEDCDQISNTSIILKVEGTKEILGGYNPLERNKNNKWE